MRAFFAHHQGMSLVALANVICDDVFVARFHADPRVQATELLLQERVPREAILSEPRPAEGDDRAAVDCPSFASQTLPIAAHDEPAHAFPVERPLHGGAHARRRRLQHVARPGGHAPARRSNLGRRRALHLPARSVVGRVWSPRYQPVCQEPDQFEATFELDKVTFRRRDGDFETQLQVTVSPEDDVEVRRLSITNRGDRPREIEVTSYAEIVLARPEDDLAHPAFGKLFIETEFDPQSAGLLFSRRPRGADEAPMWAFHVLGVEGRLGGAVEWETDRARFLGRGRSPANAGGARRPRAVRHDRRRARSDRARCAIGCAWRPAAFVRVTFATGVAPDRDAALALARKYSRRQRRGARVLDGVHARPHHAAAPGAHRRSGDPVRSAGVARVRDRCLVHQPGDLAPNTLGQPNLWGHGISGDLPIVLVRVTDAASLPLVRQLLHAQEYWRVKGLRADVVILNEHPAEYLDETQNYLTTLVQEPRWAGWNNTAGRHVPAARRRHARGRSPSARRRRTRGAARRPGRSGAAARIGRRRG